MIASSEPVSRSAVTPSSAPAYAGSVLFTGGHKGRVEKTPLPVCPSDTSSQPSAVSENKHPLVAVGHPEVAIPPSANTASARTRRNVSPIAPSDHPTTPLARRTAMCDRVARHAGFFPKRKNWGRSPECNVVWIRRQSLRHKGIVGARSPHADHKRQEVGTAMRPSSSETPVLFPHLPFPGAVQEMVNGVIVTRLRQVPPRRAESRRCAVLILLLDGKAL